MLTTKLVIKFLIIATKDLDYIALLITVYIVEAIVRLLAIVPSNIILFSYIFTENSISGRSIWLVLE